ncbi:MAG: hypothetical protein WC292_01255 [Clostridia bacterium]
MKKILEKIVTITLAFIGLLFVILMLVLMFKPEYAENLNNQLVHVLIIIFSGIFAILTVLNIATAFSDADKINSVLLFKTRSSATKASIGVVKRTAKNAVRQVEGAKMKKVSLFIDENNDVRLRIDIKVVSEDVESLVLKLRAIVINTFEEVLGLVFSSVDFKLVKVKNNFQPDSDKIDQAVAEFKAEQEQEKAEKARRLAEESKAAEDAKSEADQTSDDETEVEIKLVIEKADDEMSDEVVADDDEIDDEMLDEVVADDDDIDDDIDDDTDDDTEYDVEIEVKVETEGEEFDKAEGESDEKKPFAEENIEEIVSEIPSEVVDNIIDPLKDE